MQYRQPRDEFEADLFYRVIDEVIAKWGEENRIHVVTNEPNDDGSYPLIVTKRVPFNPRHYFDAPSVEGTIGLVEHLGRVGIVYTLPHQPHVPGASGHIGVDAEALYPSTLIKWED
jgi:hypothetical protein